MKNFKSITIETFGSYKCKNQSDEFKQIPIYNQNDLFGFLKPVTFNYKFISPEYVSLLSQWRRENPVGFASIFDVTDTRTEFWLDNILLKREDRILFMIYSLDNIPIGHLGFSSFNFEKRSCEVDNVVRGVKTGYKGIMSYALKAIILWGRNKLNLQDIYLRVLSDNKHAINFYERNNFIKQFDIPLYKVTQKDETKWVESKSYENEIPDRYYTFMKLMH